MSQLEEKRTIFRYALAEVIRKQREKKGMSLTQLGARAGLSQQSVSYVERKMRYPNAETLFRIAKAFEIELSQLIKDAEEFAAQLEKVGCAPEDIAAAKDDLRFFAESTSSRRCPPLRTGRQKRSKMPSRTGQAKK